MCSRRMAGSLQQIEVASSNMGQPYVPCALATLGGDPAVVMGFTMSWQECPVLLRASLRPDLESMAAACSAESTS